VHLVLLHPLPLDGSIWHPALTADPAALAPTLYGAGDSLAAWARAVLDLAPDGPLFVVGNSVGGSCALEIAGLAPDRVAGLVLIGSKPGVRPEPSFRDEAIRLLRSDGGLAAAWDRYWAPLFAPDADPTVVERARRLTLAAEVEDIVRGVWAFHTRTDRSELLVSLTCPVTIVRGAHDRIPADAPALAASLHRGRFVEIAGAGHYVPLEAPDELAEVIHEARAVSEKHLR
jgi:pimeloyl-ACP methyl ester carboxylesterase